MKIAWLLAMLGSGHMFMSGLLAAGAPTPTANPGPTRGAGWLDDPARFPIAVWLQDPRNARRYQAAGINLYVGLWRGPTEAQLAELRAAGMPVICAQNEAGLRFKSDPIIAGWMHDDEPDNAQSLPQGHGYGPPVLPEVVVADYHRMRLADPSRPVLLNLGQGVAWDDYIGRGVRRNHPEDYPAYVAGADIVSFDIYPVVHDAPQVRGRLEFVARGVERLVGWTGGQKRVWNCIECTHISNPDAKATPEQVRAEVWMALIRGSRGLIYFVHQFKPVFREGALLDDPPMVAAVTAINREVQELAAVLHQPNVTEGIEVTTAPSGGRVAWMAKQRGTTRYLFMVNLTAQPMEATVRWAELPADAAVEEWGIPGRRSFEHGRLTDPLPPYGVRRYVMRAP